MCFGNSDSEEYEENAGQINPTMRNKFIDLQSKKVAKGDQSTSSDTTSRAKSKKHTDSVPSEQYLSNIYGNKDINVIDYDSEKGWPKRDSQTENLNTIKHSDSKRDSALKNMLKKISETNYKSKESISNFGDYLEPVIITHDTTSNSTEADKNAPKSLNAPELSTNIKDDDELLKEATNETVSIDSNENIKNKGQIPIISYNSTDILQTNQKTSHLSDKSALLYNQDKYIKPKYNDDITNDILKNKLKKTDQRNYRLSDETRTDILPDLQGINKLPKKNYESVYINCKDVYLIKKQSCSIDDCDSDDECNGFYQMPQKYQLGSRRKKKFLVSKKRESILSKPYCCQCQSALYSSPPCEEMNNIKIIRELI